MTLLPADTATGRNATAERAIDVLLLFDEEHPVLSAGEIARRLAMPRSTTYRYLQTLRSYNLIEDGARGGYRLGTRILQLARIARQGLGLVEVARVYMEELATQIGEVVLLTRRTGNQVVCVERTEGDPRHSIRLSYERGQVLPSHAGASAKVLLAFSDPPDVDRVLSSAGGLPRYTARTTTDVEQIREQLAQIKEQGYVISFGEVDQGVIGIAAPVLGPDGRIAAGLSLVGPEIRMEADRLDGALQAVRKTANAISDRLKEIDA